MDQQAQAYFSLLNEAFVALKGEKLSQQVLDTISDHYCEPKRHYHTLQHIQECLDVLVECEQHTNNRAEVIIALWMHDVIYIPGKKDNELKSAELAKDLMLKSGINIDSADRVYKHIMATQSHAACDDPDSQLVVDIDMLILAAKEPRLQEYENQIRKEYPLVPGFIYRKKRKQVLKGFLAQTAIYGHPLIREQYEQKARENIRTLIGMLS